MTKAVALLSGGLDSTLAILAVLRQDIKVTAIKFLTPFDPEISDASSHLRDPYPLAQRFGFDVEVRGLGTEFLDMVKNPKHGYGKNMNPCIDCRILMLKHAKKVMQDKGADFIVTGEVLGQRPMSQKRDMLYHIDKEAGVVGMVLRPLSARLLRNTIAEEKMIVNRALLHALNGRSRKPQMTLAREFGLQDYPKPAGGCLLTEPLFAHRLADLLKHSSSPALRDIDLLRTGRHFRVSPLCKIIVGRDERENDLIQSLSLWGDGLLHVEEWGSPMTVISGEITEERIRIAASICARYSDAKHLSLIDVRIEHMGRSECVSVQPASEECIRAYRI